ncbi:hypothetical protein [Paenibacillus monticola]|uniref:Uncharacterized protein n=1 Tax=Paenibacillus monticola TaxID=2666075 RepID=A0A7X2H3B9_9BACL|nr:hypothetical protein [Paenibacillus monticola]MRN51963.1 hypothetical protein [Paenibacillus monticola]
MKEAIDKIKAEMELDQHPHVQVIGNYLLQVLEVNPTAAEKILVEDKTIAKAITTMAEESEKKAQLAHKDKSGEVIKNELHMIFTKTQAIIMYSADQVFDFVLKYFGIAGSPAPVIQAAAAPTPATPSKGRFDISLDDLL